MSGPFGYPWVTFSAVIAVAVAAVAAVVWAVFVRLDK